MIFAHQNTVYFGSANFSPDAFVPEQAYVNYTDETVYVTTDASVVNSFMTKFDDAWVDTSNYASWANPPASLVRHYARTSIDPELNFPPGEDFAVRSVDRYNAETSKIDVMMFRITDRRHTDAIIAAAARGIPVRIIVDPGEYRLRERLWDAWNVDRLYMAHIPIRITVHQGIDHGKLVLLYGQGMTIFGSSNWTTPSANSQHEQNYFTTKTNIFSWFVNYFDRRWNNSSPSKATETSAFTPLPPDKPVYQTPATGTVGLGVSGVKLVWDGGPFAHNYDIYFGASPTPPLYAANKNLGPDDPTKSPKQYQSLTLPTLAPATTYYWQIVSKTMANQTKAGPIWSFTTGGSAPASNLPSPWADHDIGSVPVAGSAQYSNATFTVQGSGADVWGTADAFHFVYHTLAGNGSIQAQVASVQQANAWSKGGVMIRESLASNSKHAFMLVSSARGVALQWRPTTGGSTLNLTGSSAAPPRWVRLVRNGSTITGYESADGVTWKAVGSETISMASTVYVGLAVTSHTTTAATTATISNVTTSP